LLQDVIQLLDSDWKEGSAASDDDGVWPCSPAAGGEGWEGDWAEGEGESEEKGTGEGSGKRARREWRLGWAAREEGGLGGAGAGMHAMLWA
jgi:hypothetical protein